MDLLVLKDFFQTMFFINMGIMAYWVIVPFFLLKNFYPALLEKFWGIPKEDANPLMLKALTLYKVLWIVFVFVPYITLEIMV